MSFSSPQSFSADGRAGGRTRTDMLVYNCGLEAEKKSFVHSRMGRRAADRPLFRPPAPASAARPSPFSAVLNFIPSFAPPNLPASRPAGRGRRLLARSPLCTAGRGRARRYLLQLCQKQPPSSKFERPAPESSLVTPPSRPFIPFDTSSSALRDWGLWKARDIPRNARTCCVVERLTQTQRSVLPSSAAKPKIYVIQFFTLCLFTEPLFSFSSQFSIT